MKELKYLMINDKNFLPAFNEFNVFLNDLLNEVPDNYTEGFIKKFGEKDGIFNLIFEIYGKS